MDKKEKITKTECPTGYVFYLKNFIKKSKILQIGFLTLKIFFLFLKKNSNKIQIRINAKIYLEISLAKILNIQQA